jgi:hypothetical protein
MVTLAIIVTVVLHTLAVPVMIWALRGEQGLKGLGDGWWPGSDGGGGGGSDRLPKEPKTPSPAGGLPLPTSVPSDRRLRGHDDALARPSERRHTRPDRSPAEPPARPHVPARR